jgi:pimeloyl-ACP methyl ester carboxylesterase
MNVIDLNRIFLATLLVLMSSCANPTKVIQSDIDRFKQDYRKQIQFFQSKNQKMQFAWSGDSTKRPVLFIHGSPGSWEGWVKFLLNPVLQKQFQLIAIDRPGYGGSGLGEAVTSLKTQADDILEVLKFNKSNLPAILVGHSYGGPVIARSAIDYSEKVSGLVFVASSVSPELEKTKWFQYPANWWPIRVLIPTALRVCNEEILPLKGELQSMLPFWKQISAKVAIIQGGKDDLVQPENLDFLLNHLNPKVIISVVREPELNHFVPWKRPELIVAGILAVNRALDDNK